MTSSITTLIFDIIVLMYLVTQDEIIHHFDKTGF